MIFCEAPECGLPATHWLSGGRSAGKAFCPGHGMKAFHALSRRRVAGLTITAIAVDAFSPPINRRRSRA